MFKNKRKFHPEKGISLLPQDILSNVFSWIDIASRFSHLTLVSQNWKKITLSFSEMDRHSVQKDNFFERQMELLSDAWSPEFLSSLSRFRNLRNLIPIYGPDWHCRVEPEVDSSLIVKLFDPAISNKDKELDISSDIPFYFAFHILTLRSTSRLTSRLTSTLTSTFTSRLTEKEDGKVFPPLCLLRLRSAFFCSLVRAYKLQAQGQNCLEYSGLLSLSFPFVRELSVLPNDTKRSGRLEHSFWSGSHQFIVDFLQSAFPNLEQLNLFGKWKEIGISPKNFFLSPVNEEDIHFTIPESPFESFLKSDIFSRRLKSLAMASNLNLRVDPKAIYHPIPCVSFSLQKLDLTDNIWDFLSRNCRFPCLSTLTIQNYKPLPFETFQQIWVSCPNIKNIHFLDFFCKMEDLDQSLELATKHAPLVLQWTWVREEEIFPLLLKYTGASEGSMKILQRFGEGGTLSLFPQGL